MVRILGEFSISRKVPLILMAGLMLLVNTVPSHAFGRWIAARIDARRMGGRGFFPIRNLARQRFGGPFPLLRARDHAISEGYGFPFPALRRFNGQRASLPGGPTFLD